VLGEARRGRAKWVFACFAENLLEISREEEVKTATEWVDRGAGIRGEGMTPPHLYIVRSTEQTNTSFLLR
jgi:hypothetical protein